MARGSSERQQSPPSDMRDFPYFNREEIIELVAKRMKFIMENGLLNLQPDEVRMRDILALPKERANTARAKRAPMIERAIGYLEQMVHDDFIAPDFFHGVDSMAELAVEALDKAVADIHTKEQAQSRG